MSSVEADVKWLHTQLTVARWHLDAAIAAPIDSARRNIDRARQAYEGAQQALRELGLTGDRHETLSRELKVIRERLQAAGAEV